LITKLKGSLKTKNTKDYDGFKPDFPKKEINKGASSRLT
jgi:hypothetical protein